MKTNRYINIKAALFIAASAFISACTVEEGDLSVEPKSEQLSIIETLQLNANETDKSFDIKSDVGWDVSVDKGNWSELTISPSSGTGNGQVTIHTDANTTRQGREAQISIRTKGGVTQQMVVKQSLSEVILELVGGDSQTLSFEASPEDSQNFTFSCNTTWEITTSDSWITCSEKSGGEAITSTVSKTVSVNVAEIQTDVPREGKVFISAENGAVTRQISITQEGKKIELAVSPSTFNVVAIGEEKTIQITCNADWTLEYDNGIILCDATSGTGNKDVIVTCLPNNTEAERKTTVTVKSGIQDIKTETIEFTQAAATKPVIQTFGLVEGSVTKNEAKFTIGFDTMYPISSYGVFYWSDADSKKQKLDFDNSDPNAKEFSVTLTGLKSMTQYYVYAYIKNDIGEVTTESTNVVSFKTGGVKPNDDDNPTPNLSRRKK